eukprot:1436-Heterococcus_DN1.PRE.1
MLTEVVAVLDKTDGKTVRLCDAHTGRILADSAVTHDCEVSGTLLLPSTAQDLLLSYSRVHTPSTDCAKLPSVFRCSVPTCIEGYKAHQHLLDLEIVEIALSQFAAGVSERRLTLIDRNRDLWLYPVGGISTSKGASSKTSNSNRHKLHVQ